MYFFNSDKGYHLFEIIVAHTCTVHEDLGILVLVFCRTRDIDLILLKGKCCEILYSVHVGTKEMMFMSCASISDIAT